MICTGCANQDAYMLRSGKDWCVCNRCGDLRPADAASPDVFFSHIGQKFENLCDDMGRPYEIQSKRHKKEVMDQLGVREAGDSVNGSPFGSKNWIEGTRDFRRKQFDKERPKIRETVRAWRERARG